MSLTVAELAFVFGADVKAVDKALSSVDGKAKTTAAGMDRSMGGFWKSETDRVRAQAGQYEKAGRDAGTGFKSQFGAGVRGFAAPLAAGIAAAVGGAELVRFFGSSITAASDLNEEVSKSGVIFGDAADAVRAYAQDSTKNILLTETQAIQAASTFGVFGKAAGLAGEDLSSFSTNLVGLSSDFSSFFNARPEEAIEAIGAALRGESEPIRRFGVLLDDATLRAQALKLGLISTTKDALTPAQRAQAAYAEILAQTTDAQGDAARTQDGYANSTRILAKDFGELKTELGQKLLPVATEVVQFFSNQALPAFEATGGAVADLAGFIGDLPGPVKQAVVAIAAFKLASSMGWLSAAQSGISGLGRAFDDVRLRTMLANDTMRATPGVMGKVGVAAGGLGRGLGAAVGMLGGPWGLAFAAGTTALFHFWGESKKAKAEVEALTDTFDAQTGAITDNTRQWVINKLEQDGLLKTAQSFGINTQLITDALVGETGALEALNQEFDKLLSQNMVEDPFGDLMFNDTGRGLARLQQDLTGVAATTDEAREAAERKSAAAGDLADAEEDVAAATLDSAAANDEETKSLEDALDAMRAKRQEALRAANAELNYLSAINDAKGALDDNGRVLRKNGDLINESSDEAIQAKGALLGLAGAWNDLSNREKNSQGARAAAIGQFVDLATQMGMSGKAARDLARDIFEIPSRQVAVSVNNQQALAAIEAVRLQVANLRGKEIFIGGRAALASGGPVIGPGSGTSDSVPIMASNGEYVINAAQTARHRPIIEAINRGTFDLDKVQRRGGSGRDVMVAAASGVTPVSAGSAMPAGGRMEFVITNWSTGEGFLREIARGEATGQNDFDDTHGRMRA